MSIANLTINNFRNHNTLSISSAVKFVLITGDNGAGKTNILEAISLLSPGKGFRNAKSLELPNKFGDSKEWSVFAELHEDSGAHKIGTGLIANSNKKIFRANESTLQKQQDILDFIRVIWLTPQMDGLFLDTPSTRRKFLDRVSFNLFPEHAVHSMHYQYAMKSRNRLLSDNNFDDIWLSNLENSMVENGIKIMETRYKTIEILQSSIDEMESGFLKPKLDISCSLSTSIPDSEYKEKLKNSRIKDSRSKRCSFGSHTADLKALHPIKEIDSSFCSTGEQKAMLISLLIGQVKVLNQNGNIQPIVLLDEIFAHLDETKKKQLMDELKKLNAQFWVTSTDLSKIPIIDGTSTSISI